MKHKLLKLPSDVQRFTRGDKVIFINPALPAWVVTNELGAMVLSLFDGTVDASGVAEVVAEALGPQSRGKVLDFCQRVVDSGLLSERKEPLSPEQQDLHNVHLSVSRGCNLHCAYCYAAQRTEAGQPDLTLGEWQGVVDDLTDRYHGIMFTITGGEPLLSPLALPLAEYIAAKGCRTLLLTNGLLISEDNIQRIAQTFSLVTLSIDGTTRQSHAATRGDNLEGVLAAARLLESHGVDYTVSMTVTRLNINQVEPMAQRFGGRLNYQPLFPVSDYSNSRLSVTGAEYYAALKAAAGVNPLSYCESALSQALIQPVTKCSIADGEISISPSGDVYPCQLLHVPEFLAGNVRRHSVLRIIDHSSALARCASLHVDALPDCSRCAIRYICGGACRARGYYETGHIERSGRFCEYELNAFLDGIASIYSTDLL